jgi:NAD(P)-dependent dehydrogenase (short-subunit alcohol dehydrogenase family)
VQPHGLSVVVTNSTSRVGAAIARGLVCRGARVLLVACDAEPLAALARHLAPPDDQRYRVDALAANIATAHGCRAVIDAAAARKVNALVNAPPDAPYPLGRVDAHRGEGCERSLSAQLLTRGLLPLLRAQADARVLNIGPLFLRGTGSDTGNLAELQNTLRRTSRALGRELAGSAVRVQFLGRRVTPRAVQAAAHADHPGSRTERPDYIGSVAVQTLLAGTRERFLGLRGDLAGRVNALVLALLPTPDHRRV